jgi:hypothetical protein
MSRTPQIDMYVIHGTQSDAALVTYSKHRLCMLGCVPNSVEHVPNHAVRLNRTSGGIVPVLDQRVTQTHLVVLV